MANTTTRSGRIITITGLDANWNLATDMPDYSTSGLSVRSIRFNPSAANDKMIIRESSSAGPLIFRVMASAQTDDRIQYYYGQWMKPTITIDQCTLSAASSAYVTIEIE
jgi:hypothetical protein